VVASRKVLLFHHWSYLSDFIKFVETGVKLKFVALSTMTVALCIFLFVVRPAAVAVFRLLVFFYSSVNFIVCLAASCFVADVSC